MYMYIGYMYMYMYPYEAHPTVCSMRMTALQRAGVRGKEREEMTSSYSDLLTVSCCSHLWLTCISENWRGDQGGGGMCVVCV